MKVIISTDQELAGQHLKKWNYPFYFNRYNIYSMLQVGKSVAWIWFEKFGANDLAVHMCANPKHRGKWFTRYVYKCMVWTAQLLGKDRIYTLAKDGTDVVRYVKRLGWQQDEYGWYLCLNQ